MKEILSQGVRALSTRAYENMVTVAMANPNGDSAGCSCAFSPICWDINGFCWLTIKQRGFYMRSLIWRRISEHIIFIL